MDDNRYIDLISNASARDYPNNRASEFTVKLAKPLMLKGDWEIGLVELTHPKIDESLKHKGEVWIGGNISDSLRTEFEIDFTKPDPFEDLMSKTQSVIDKMKGNPVRNKPNLKKDGNGAFSLSFGVAQKDGDFSLQSHFKFLPESYGYLGFDEEEGNILQNYERNKDKKFKKKTSFKNNINPFHVVGATTIKNAIWVRDKIEKKDISITPAKDDTLAKIAEKLNAEIDKEWKTSQLDTGIYPKPKFSMDKNKLVYAPGYIREKVDIDVSLEFDRKSLDLMGFEGQTITGKYGHVKRAGFQPSTGLSSLMFFYTDIVEKHHVGDSMANSLRGIPIHDKIVHRIFDPIIYHPVSLKQIDKITVYIADEVGVHPRFANGIVHATVHLRRVF